jgi:hypothetical protein
VGGPAGSDAGVTAVGLVYDTQLYNPEYGAFGPRLSSEAQLEVFSPDYLNETATLLGVVVVGQRSAGRRVASGLCPVAPQVSAEVTRLTEREVRAFHEDGEGLDVGYYSLLLSLPYPIVPPLLLGVLGELENLMPERAGVLGALRTNLAWRTHVGATG